MPKISNQSESQKYPTNQKAKNIQPIRKPKKSNQSESHEQDFKLSTHNFQLMQLQMSYDDFDGSLNVHVIRAKNIQPIRKSNTADAFVKVVLLPFKK